MATQEQIRAYYQQMIRWKEEGIRSGGVMDQADAEKLSLYRSKIMRSEREQTLIDQGMDPTKAARKVRRPTGAYRVYQREQERITGSQAQTVMSGPGNAPTVLPAQSKPGLRSGLYSNLRTGTAVLVQEQSGPIRNYEAVQRFNAEQERIRAITSDPTYSRTYFYTATQPTTPRRLSNFQYSPNPETPDQPLSPAFSESFRAGAGDDYALKKPSSFGFSSLNYYGSRYITRKLMPPNEANNATFLDVIGGGKKPAIMEKPFIRDVGEGITTTIRDKPASVVATGIAGASVGAAGNVALRGGSLLKAGYVGAGSIAGGVYAGSVGYEVATTDRPGIVVGREAVLLSTFTMGFKGVYKPLRPPSAQLKLNLFTDKVGTTEPRVPLITDSAMKIPTPRTPGRSPGAVFDEPTGQLTLIASSTEKSRVSYAEDPKVFRGKGGRLSFPTLLEPKPKPFVSGPRRGGGLDLGRQAEIIKEAAGFRNKPLPPVDLPKVGSRPSVSFRPYTGLGLIGAINRQNIGLNPIVSPRSAQNTRPAIQPRVSSLLPQKQNITPSQATTPITTPSSLIPALTVSGGIGLIGLNLLTPGGGSSTTSQTEIPKPKEPTPGLGLFGVSGGAFGRRGSSGLVGGIKTGYAPSLFALTAGITSTKAPRLPGGFSGLEVRPVIVAKKRRKRRKK